MDHTTHIPVMLEEVLRTLRPAPGETYGDATAGHGGHAAAVARLLGPTGRVVINDADPGNLASASAHVRAAAPPGQGLVGLRGNFAEMPHRLAEAGVALDMLLADLGFASGQIEDASRGFSFKRDGPLDMRLDPSIPLSAADLVNSASEGELARILSEFGEERNARRIARKVVQERAQTPIATTGRLAAIVRASNPGDHGGIDPATRSFQAIRIAVNDELGCLDALLGHISRAAAEVRAGRTSWLRPGARIGFLTFHSLEDRPVKRALGELVKAGAVDVTGGAMVAGKDELVRNPRAGSAKLRVVRLSGA